MKIKLIAISILLGASLSAQAGFVSVPSNDAHGGHVKKHVNQTDTQLKAKVVCKKFKDFKTKGLKFKTGMCTRHSSYKSAAFAKKIILKMTGAAATELDTWMHGNQNRYTLVGDPGVGITGKVGHATGFNVNGGVIKKISKAKKACIVLAKRESNSEWFVLTSFPVIIGSNCRIK